MKSIHKDMILTIHIYLWGPSMPYYLIFWWSETKYDRNFGLCRLLLCQWCQCWTRPWQWRQCPRDPSWSCWPGPGVRHVAGITAPLAAPARYRDTSSPVTWPRDIHQPLIWLWQQLIIDASHPNCFWLARCSSAGLGNIKYNPSDSANPIPQL